MNIDMVGAQSSVLGSESLSSCQEHCFELPPCQCSSCSTHKDSTPPARIRLAQSADPPRQPHNLQPSPSGNKYHSDIPEVSSPASSGEAPPSLASLLEVRILGQTQQRLSGPSRESML